ncbi:hypothetical protein B194_5422 [Serratia plymuthica A30]|nr:hypothetical protein B194_5422 [Serratia plymuthica A30]
MKIAVILSELFLIESLILLPYFIQCLFPESGTTLKATVKSQLGKYQ